MRGAEISADFGVVEGGRGEAFPDFGNPGFRDFGIDWAAQRGASAEHEAKAETPPAPNFHLPCPIFYLLEDPQ